jgi:hypothetical protein
MMDQLPPKPSGTGFGIEIDGRRDRTGFRSIAEAEQEAAAHGIVEEGRKVAIFDLATGRVVKRLS